MTEQSLAPIAATPAGWNVLVQSLKRPYPVSIPMVFLVSLVPLYIFLPEFLRGRDFHAPAVALDAFVPVVPGWALVYGPLYLFLILLPVFVVRSEAQIRQTVRAYLLVWLTAYFWFVAYPTVAPRPAELVGEGFGMWALRILYSADPPYNCFPSLHVAHSFVSALTVRHVHREAGTVAIICASLVGLSTLFTKQHYVLDVVFGVLLAWVACFLFLRNYPREEVPELDRRLAPLWTAGLLGLAGLLVLGSWVVYLVV